MDKKIYDNYVITTILVLFVPSYFLPSLVAFLIGLSDANNVLLGHCYTKWSKIEYAYPAYRIGCYLNKNEE